MGREVVFTLTGGKLHLGPWEHIFSYEFDGRRRKRVLVKIIGESCRMVRAHGGAVDGDAVLGKYSRLPAEQIEFVLDATLETVRSIDRGVVFLVAF